VSGEQRPGCYDKAVELLARRAHFRAELRQKLVARGYPDEEVEETLGRLVEEGYLDDRQTAAEFVEGRLARGPEGRRRLAAELARRGAPAAAIGDALDEKLPGDDLTAAREAAERFLRAGRRDPGALARHLDRKGFSRRSILTLLDELGLESEPGAGVSDSDAFS
jgi:regulatory protein